MRVIDGRGRAAAAAAEPPREAPPEWWPAAWARRQRRLRAILARKLSAVWISTQMAHQLCHGYEREEMECALATMAGEGLLDVDARTEAVASNRSDSTHRVYWRLRAGAGVA